MDIISDKHSRLPPNEWKVQDHRSHRILIFIRGNSRGEAAYLHAALPLRLQVSQLLLGGLKTGLALGEGGQNSLYFLLHLLGSCPLPLVRPLLPRDEVSFELGHLWDCRGGGGGGGAKQ